MDEYIDIDTARLIMQKNFIGIDEIKTIEEMSLAVNRVSLSIPFSAQTLEKKKNDYILLPGVSRFRDEKPVTIRNMIQLFGKNPLVFEPCFYNQDWYNNESFIDIPLTDGWYLIRKKVYEYSRGVQPQELLKSYIFPSAVSCTYAFFVTWFIRGEKLWYHDFVWCNDKDHNGDRIYVGKYNDIDGINKNGFNIHRHLNLRDCYGCID